MNTKRIRLAGPPGVTRPFTPSIAVTDDVEGQKADALDHIARALSAIDRNLEVLTEAVRANGKSLARIAAHNR